MALSGEPVRGAKQHAPATLRNREPIREILGDVLAPLLPAGGRVLEVGAGTGEHAVHFAAAFPSLTWQPTDADPASLASIAAYAADAALPNLCEPRQLDVCTLPWPAIGPAPFDAVLSVNLIHIAPWSACAGLMAGAASVLRDGGLLILYGPFMLDRRHTAPSNSAFDDWLRAMDSRYGVRDAADVAAEAAVHGFALLNRVDMPANNFILVFVRRS